MRAFFKLSIAALACLPLLGSGCQITRTTDNAADPTPSVTVADPLSGWKTYTDSGRGFRFRHPADTVASYDRTSNTIYLKTGTEQDDNVPDMTVSVIDGGVQMKTWEGMEIPYFKQLVSSFQYE